MNFTVSNEVKSEGTSLVGYVTTSRNSLVEVFGEPNYTSSDESDKVTTEWDIEFADGTIATIYDWKRYEEGAPTSTEIYEWHIGGNSKDAVEKVKSSLLHRPVVISLS